MTKAAPGIRLESVTVNPCCVEIRKSQEPLGNREGRPVGWKLRVRIRHLREYLDFQKAYWRFFLVGWKEKDKIEYGVLSLVKRVMSRTFIRYCNSQQGKTGIQGRAMKYKSGHVRIKQLSGNREKIQNGFCFCCLF